MMAINECAKHQPRKKKHCEFDSILVLHLAKYEKKIYFLQFVIKNL